MCVSNTPRKVLRRRRTHCKGRRRGGQFAQHRLGRARSSLYKVDDGIETDWRCPDGPKQSSKQTRDVGSGRLLRPPPAAGPRLAVAFQTATTTSATLPAKSPSLLSLSPSLNTSPSSPSRQRVSTTARLCRRLYDEGEEVIYAEREARAKRRRSDPRSPTLSPLPRIGPLQTTRLLVFPYNAASYRCERDAGLPQG